MNEVTYIPLSFTPGVLYLTSRSILNRLSEFQIDHLVSITDVSPISPPLLSRHTILDIYDSVDPSALQGMKRDMDQIITEMHQSLTEGKRVCVHCNAGISRSSTIVTAYLMKYEKMTLEQALAKISALRPIVRPNPGFMRILIEFESSL